VKFLLKHTLEDLYIDFRGEKIVAIVVNGEKVNVEWNGLFIKVAKEKLTTAKENVVNIQFL
jgi:hypothetical protein